MQLSKTAWVLIALVVGLLAVMYMRQEPAMVEDAGGDAAVEESMMEDDAMEEDAMMEEDSMEESTDDAMMEEDAAEY